MRRRKGASRLYHFRRFCSRLRRCNPDSCRMQVHPQTSIEDLDELSSLLQVYLPAICLPPWLILVSPIGVLGNPRYRHLLRSSMSWAFWFSGTRLMIRFKSRETHHQLRCGCLFVLQQERCNAMPQSMRVGVVGVWYRTANRLTFLDNTSNQMRLCICPIGFGLGGAGTWIGLIAFRPRSESFWHGWRIHAKTSLP